MMEQQVTEWLLQAQTPTIRYLTLVQLLGLPEDDPQVVAQRQAIMEEGPVPAIFARQTGSGSWADEHSFYTPKYRSTHWSLTLLAELLVDSSDLRFQRGVNFMLGDTAAALDERLAEDNLGWSCFYGNMLRYTCHAGLSSDERATVLIDYALRDIANGNCRCDWNDGYACVWGMARTLWGLAALPQEQRTAAVEQAIAQGLEFLLQPSRLPAADYPTPDNGRIHTIWSRLNFPLFYQADILFLLRAAAELGALERVGAQGALAWLAEKRQKNGRWRGSSPYRSRTWPEMGGPEETSRWVTLQAASLMDAFENQQVAMQGSAE